MPIARRVALGLTAVTCWSASSVAGQAAEGQSARVWNLRGLRSQYCVEFLIDPRTVSGKLKDAYSPVRADQDPNLHSALRHTIEGQPEFAGWSPSRLCFYFSDTLQFDGRRFIEANRRKHQLLGAWTLAARDGKTGTRRDLVIDLYASRGNLIRAAERSGVRLREAESGFTSGADTTTDTHRVKFDGTLVIWRGRPAGDSTRVQQPMEETWSLRALRGGVLSGRLVRRAQWSRSLVGSLTVEGKGDLAKALKSSPIRFVGPLYRGGEAELRFTR